MFFVEVLHTQTGFYFQKAFCCSFFLSFCYKHTVMLVLVLNCIKPVCFSSSSCREHHQTGLLQKRQRYQRGRSHQDLSILFNIDYPKLHGALSNDIRSRSYRGRRRINEASSAALICHWACRATYRKCARSRFLSSGSTITDLHNRFMETIFYPLYPHRKIEQQWPRFIKRLLFL